MSVATALLLAIFLPLCGSIGMLTISSAPRQSIRSLALAVTVVTLGLALYLLARFQPSGDEYLRRFLIEGGQAGETFDAMKTAFAATQWSWLPAATGIDVRFSVGLDGLG